MSNIEILDNLKSYLQGLIDDGTHKIFYNDLMWDEKTIDCINAIDEIIEENKRFNNIINKAIEYIENSDKYDFSKCELLDILKGSDKE